MPTFTLSSGPNPCPMCDRTKDGDCRILDTGIVLCHTILNGVDLGKKHPDRPFIYCGQSDDAQGFGKWLPEHLASEPLTKAPREPLEHRFDYRLWDGGPAPRQRLRIDYSDGRPKKVTWAGKLGIPEAEIAPFAWHETQETLGFSDDPLFVVKGELKAKQLTDLGHCAISILGVSERLITELRQLGRQVVLAPDCDLADLQKWCRELTQALPQCRYLLVPMKGLNWRQPPEHGGLGIEDWLQTSKPSSAVMLAAITSEPWKPSQEAAPAVNDPVEQLRKAIDASATVRTLKLGLKLLEDVASPTERFVGLQRLREQTNLTASRAFDQAIATLIDEQRNDKDCTHAELMARNHDATFTIDQFGARGALVGIGGDKGDGKTLLMYRAAIAVASGESLFGELTVEQGPVILVQTDESDTNAIKKFKAMGADGDLPIHWRWGFNPSMVPDLKRQIIKTGAKFIGIDSVTTVAGGRGIKTTDPEFSLFLYQLNALAAELGVVIFILIHLRKPDSIKGRTEVTMNDFLGTGMLTAACSDVFGYWPNRQPDAFPDQFILRCLGKRNCEAGVTWDLQGSKDDYSLTFAGVQGGGATPSEQRSCLEKALGYLRQRRGECLSPSGIATAINSSERTVKKLLRDYYSSGNALAVQRVKGESTGGRPSWHWRF